MTDSPDLSQFVDQALQEELDEASDIFRKDLSNEQDRYELLLMKKQGEGQAKLVLKRKGNGRPVPVLIVNAISGEGKNLLYRDRRMDRTDKVIGDVKEALQAMIKSLKSS